MGWGEQDTALPLFPPRSLTHHVPIPLAPSIRYASLLSCTNSSYLARSRFPAALCQPSQAYRSFL